MLKLNNKVALLSLLIFILSLFFNAFKVKDLGEIRDYKSIEVFLSGPISFLGGGIFEFLIWTANIWFFTSILCIYRKYYLSAILTGFIGLCISGSFLFWKEILAAENGRMGEIYSFEAGYFLWIISILLIFFFSVYLKINNKSNAQA
jgi:hypothetical protein